ncbi:MAG: hypothetical protein AAFQ39_03730 [Pseudomonadota bacterium]
MNIILLMVLLLGFLPCLAMFLHARQNSWRHSIVTFVVVTLCLPFAVMAVVLLASVLMGRTVHLSFDTLAYYLPTSSPQIMLFFGAPMLVGLLLGRLAARVSQGKAGTP